MIASVESFVNLTHAHPTLGYRQQKYFLTPYHTHTSEYGALAEIDLKCGVVRESHACTPYKKKIWRPMTLIYIRIWCFGQNWSRVWSRLRFVLKPNLLQNYVFRHPMKLINMRIRGLGREWSREWSRSWIALTPYLLQCTFSDALWNWYTSEYGAWAQNDLECGVVRESRARTSFYVRLCWYRLGKHTLQHTTTTHCKTLQHTTSFYVRLCW